MIGLIRRGDAARHWVEEGKTACGISVTEPVVSGEIIAWAFPICDACWRAKAEEAA